MASKKERTREMILDASYPLFAKEGFNKITMKDICDATGLSRGGLYAHFAGTREIFEAILLKIRDKDGMNFQKEMAEGMSATAILKNALKLMEEEMAQPEDSLSLAMVEYAEGAADNEMAHFTQMGEDKWTDLIAYGIKRGEFKEVDIFEVVNMILYVYQGVRMWSRVAGLTEKKIKSITKHIEKQLLEE